MCVCVFKQIAITTKCHKNFNLPYSCLHGRLENQPPTIRVITSSLAIIGGDQTSLSLFQSTHSRELDLSGHSLKDPIPRLSLFDLIQNLSRGKSLFPSGFIKNNWRLVSNIVAS